MKGRTGKFVRVFIFFLFFFSRLILFVDRARDKETGEIVALKEVKLDVDDKRGFSIISLRECTLLMQLNHENVLNVTEVVVGQTLKRYLDLDYLDL